MAEKSGFYPSNEKLGIKNEYTGYEFGNLYKHLISNGVFATQQGTPSNYLQVVASSGLVVNVLPGAGIFDGQWYELDTNKPLTLDGENSLNRIDLIVIEVNKSPNVLKTEAKVIKGVAAAVPSVPTLVDTEYVKYYPIAEVLITAGVPTITQSSITDLRGIAPTLWITSLIQQLDTSTLWNQFSTAFAEWFANVKETLISSTLMRKYTGHTYSITENQKEIEVPIAQYNSVIDILQVHIEGRILREGVDYVKNGLTGITLTLGLPVVNTLVYFEIFKSVDGSDAESIAQLLYNLEDRVDAISQTNVLYTTATGNWVRADAVITPLKKLSQCKTGYVLHFAKYGDIDNMIHHYHLPKVRYNGTYWTGQNVVIDMPHNFSDDGNTLTWCMKKLCVYDDKITGYAANAVGNSLDMVLVAITEY